MNKTIRCRKVDAHMLSRVIDDTDNRGQVQIVVLVLLIALAVALVGFLGPTLIGFVGEVSENPDANVDIDPQFEDGSVDIILRSIDSDTEAIEVEHTPRDGADPAAEFRFVDDPDETAGTEGGVLDEEPLETGSAKLSYGNTGEDDGEQRIEEGDLVVVTAVGANDETTIREYEAPENIEA